MVEADRSGTAVSDPACAPALLPDHAAKVALLVVDFQVDFTAPDGFCALHGADVSAIPAAATAAREAIAAARASGAPVCFIRLETSARTDSPAMLKLMESQGRPGGAALCRKGTPGAGYWGLQPAAGDHEIVKSRYDAFLETGLDGWLRREAIETVVVCGVSTDCCVDSTARSAFMRDYDVVVLGDACAAGDRADHDAALAALGRYAARVVQVRDFVEALAAIAPQGKAADRERGANHG